MRAYDDVGLQDHNRVLETDVVQGPSQPAASATAGAGFLGCRVRG
ncbi:hypothetical protein ACWCP6_21485 [Streptomyces sp. NPDC002004]